MHSIFRTTTRSARVLLARSHPRALRMAPRTFSTSMPPGEEDMDNSGSRDPAIRFMRPRPADVVTSIVESVAADVKDSTRVLAVLCDNEAGVLSRVAGTLSARGFNIDSLTVSPTNIPDLSRMTIVMKHVPDTKAMQALKQLSDIVNVWAVVDYSGTNSLARELVMVKVSYLPNSGNFRADASSKSRPSYRALLDAQPHRAAVRDLGELFGAEVVDVGSRRIVFQLTSWSRRIDAFIRMLEPWGIIEVARSGVVAMLRSPVSGTESDLIKTPTTLHGLGTYFLDRTFRALYRGVRRQPVHPGP